ncbi:hypothetical protein HNQ50_001402 [Silvimonas terrae]|uniref:Uncharacterized protein n=1 Tax=Silvimonas terrae TaxID=300266 RepID=A0A840RE79_9NEIS|nr:hypothetical protein [Silvimonas terrae]MBB5190680.1 hypothetical protein [Silvimonas terrae]
MLALPAFNPRLDPGAHKLKEIIAGYTMPENVNCGLSNCRTPHQQGYVVQTEDGMVTNIGSVCGKNYFGVDFTRMSRDFEQKVKDKDNRERLEKHQHRVSGYHSRIKTLRAGDRGGDWVYQMQAALTTPNKGVPVLIIRQLRDLQRTGIRDVMMSRPATEEEIKLDEIRLGDEIKQRPYFISAVIGTVVGAEVLGSEDNIKKLLIDDLTLKLEEFKRVKILELSSTQLTRWNKYFSDVELKLTTAGRIIAGMQTLATRENLGFLEALLKEDKEKAEFERFLIRLDSPPASVE